MLFQKPLNFRVVGCEVLVHQQHIPKISKSKKTALCRPQPAQQSGQKGGRLQRRGDQMLQFAAIRSAKGQRLVALEELS